MRDIYKKVRFFYICEVLVMKSLELPVEAMLPRILLAREFELCATTEKTKGRVSYSYEIGFYLGGSGKLCVNGKEYAINYGDVRFTRPGTHLDSTPSYKCYTINFDFGENSTIYRNQILDNIPEYFNTTGELAKQFETVIKCFTSNEVHSKLRANAALMHIIYAVFDTFYSKKKYCDAVRRCIAYIEKNYADKVTLERLGEISGYSDLHTMRLFKHDTGRTPHEWLTEIRVNRAKELLSDGDKNIEEIASACGFGSESHFKILFKRITGITPGVYRKNARLI